jgi:hypothetical protein
MYRYSAAVRAERINLSKKNLTLSKMLAVRSNDAPEPEDFWLFLTKRKK